jgi:hypothetical protein
MSDYGWLVNWLVVDDQRSSSLIKGIHLGVLAPGVSAVKTMHLFNTGAGGDRMLDVSILTSPVSDTEEETGGEEALHDEMEHLKMLVVPTVAPIKTAQSISYRHASGSWSGLADLQTFDESFWDNRRGGEAIATATMSCVGPWSLRIESVQLERQVRPPPNVYT